MRGLGSRVRMLLAGGVVAATVLLAGVGTGQATFPGADGRIVFQNPRGGAFFTINGSGSQETRIPGTGPGAINFEPSFSADGRKIVFVHYKPRSGGHRQAWTIVSMRPDGTDRKVLVKRLRFPLADPAFSPSGHRVVFAYRDDIYAVTPGNDQDQLTGDRGHDLDPSYSPDGDLVVWNVGNRIRVMTAHGTKEHTVARGPNYAEPSFSPDGKRILFTGGPSKFDTAVRNILETNVDGSRLHNVTNDAGTSFVYHDPHFSPSGTRIVATGTNPNPECNACDQLQIMNAHGGGRRRLTTRSSFHPDWGPAAG